MRIVEIIKRNIELVPQIEQFISSSRFILNYETDNDRLFPIAYLDRPLRVNGVRNDQGTIIEQLQVTMLFADLQGEHVDSVAAQVEADKKIEIMRYAALMFITAIQNDPETALLQSVNYSDVVNFYDASVCGVVLNFSINLRVETPYPCVPHGT